MCCALVNCTIKATSQGRGLVFIFTTNHHCRSNQARLNINPSSQLITRRHCRRGGKREGGRGRDELRWCECVTSPVFHTFLK